MKNRIEHSGQIIDIDNATGGLKVKIEARSACGGCHARSSCSGANVEGAEKIIDVTPPQGQNFEIGDKVMLYITNAIGGRAVVIAYIIPVIICIGSLVVMSVYKIEDNIAGLISLGAVMLYLFILFTFRRKISKKINIEIDKI